MKTLKGSVDRIESGVAVIITDSGKKFEVPAEQYGLSANDIVELTADESGVKTIEKNDAERDERLTKNKERLRSLFRNKK